MPYWVLFLVLKCNPSLRKRVSSSRLGMWVFSFPECNFRIRNVSFKSHFFRNLQRPVGPLGVFTMFATVIIKWNSDLGFTPPAATCFYCFRSVFPLSSSHIQSSCSLSFPILLLGFPPVYAREAISRFSDGAQEINQGGRVRLRSQLSMRSGTQVSVPNLT